MTNEAAERLLLFVEDELQPQFKSSMGYAGWQKAALAYFSKELATEHRATVERIRANVNEAFERGDIGEADREFVAAFLDEELAADATEAAR